MKVALFLLMSALACGWARAEEPAYVFGCDCLVGDCTNELATAAGRQRAIDWFRRHHVTKVYVESFRHGAAIPTARLREIRDEFRAAGLTVGGCFTPTNLKPVGREDKAKKMDYEQWCCYTDPDTLEVLRTEVARAAALFDFVIIDDFLFTHCTCARCTEQKGTRSWTDFRCELMRGVCRQIDAAAKAANPKCTFIVKFPCWYGGYRGAGYDVAAESRILGASWVGTETRDWGVPTQAFWIQAWMNLASGGLCGGGWFDALMTSDPAKYVEQARYTILGGARETILHCYFHLGAPEPPVDPNQPYRRVIRWHDCAEAFRREVDGLERLAKFVRGAELKGIPFARAADAEGEDRAVAVLRGGVPVKPVLADGVKFPFDDEKTYPQATAAELAKVQAWAAAQTGVDFSAPGDVSLHLYEQDGQRYAAVVNLRKESVTVRLGTAEGASAVLLALPTSAAVRPGEGKTLVLAPGSLAFCRLPGAPVVGHSQPL